jgi:hypothetical protein
MYLEMKGERAVKDLMEGNCYPAFVQLKKRIAQKGLVVTETRSFPFQ